jgi:hypothetical protein
VVERLLSKSEVLSSNSTIAGKKSLHSPQDKKQNFLDKDIKDGVEVRKAVIRELPPWAGGLEVVVESVIWKSKSLCSANCNAEQREAPSSGRSNQRTR